MSLTKENGKLIGTLTEQDRKMKLDSVKRGYNGIQDFILVHKTDYPPTNNVIKTSKSSGVKEKFAIELDGETYELEVPSERNTIHFAVNGEVSSHKLGNWDNMKYAILIPFKDIQKEQVVCANPVDTFAYGDVSIPTNAYVLCPNAELDDLRRQNPNANIIGYEGETVSQYANLVVSELGYQFEFGGEHKWDDGNSSKQFVDIIQREGYYWGSHKGSKYQIDEVRNTLANEVVEVLKFIKDKRNCTKQ